MVTVDNDSAILTSRPRHTPHRQRLQTTPTGGQLQKQHTVHVTESTSSSPSLQTRRLRNPRSNTKTKIGASDVKTRDEGGARVKEYHTARGCAPILIGRRNDRRRVKTMTEKQIPTTDEENRARGRHTQLSMLLDSVKRMSSISITTPPRGRIAKPRAEKKSSETQRRSSTSGCPNESSESEWRMFEKC